eukprot:7253816-Alexandrium_andersonii.AAC.1
MPAALGFWPLGGDVTRPQPSLATNACVQQLNGEWWLQRLEQRGVAGRRQQREGGGWGQRRGGAGAGSRAAQRRGALS